MSTNVVLADPLMGYLMVLQSGITGSARAVLARVGMRSPIDVPELYSRRVRRNVCFMHGCVNQPQATDFPGGSTRRYLLHVFNELDSSPLASIFVLYQVGLAETVMLRPNLFGGRRLDRKHPARFPRANLIRNVSSATVDGKRRYWIWQ